MDNDKLSVVVVGAGIAGLTAALAMRAYADVLVLEAAHELKEIGAAVTLGSGVVNMMRRWGVRLEDAKPVSPQIFQTWSADGQLLHETPFGHGGAQNNDTLAIHRADLQKALLNALNSEQETTQSCKVLLGKRVVQAVPETGTVTTADGSIYSADVVIGADGIRSSVRAAVVGESTRLQSGRMSAYRFLVSLEAICAKNHPYIKEGSEKMLMIQGGSRVIIAYPVRSGTLMNVVCLIPDSHADETAHTWTTKSDVKSVLEDFKDFAPVWKDLLECAQDVGLWQLKDIDPLATWVKGRMILIGDAAHAMLPFRASGAFSAIEDAEAVGAYLEGVSRAEVPDALDRIFRGRFRRATSFQKASRAWTQGGEQKNEEHADLKDESALFEEWNYPGVKAWIGQHPEMMLKQTK